MKLSSFACYMNGLLPKHDVIYVLNTYYIEICDSDDLL